MSSAGREARRAVRSRVAGGRIGLHVLLVTTTAAAWSHAVAASGPTSEQQRWLNDAAARPRLEAAPAPEAPGIRLPNAMTSQLLLSQRELQVPAPLRLLVFAPHPDDETLAAGGLIQRVLATHGQVRVVFVTNGDGFVDGVRREVRRTRTSTADFIEYGKRRHDEALQALRTVGLQGGASLFLGFPDDGIDDLWAGHWSARQPYTSPYTRFDRPRYKESFSRRVRYAGTDLEAEIAATLRNFKPDWVVMPDPRDRHPDHCTTGVFVLDALRKLREDGMTPFERTEVFTYLVHYPDYPASPGWAKDIESAGVGGSTTASHVLAGAQWLHLPLTMGEQAVKEHALSAYATQVQVMNPFLKQFLRDFELFGHLDATQVLSVPRAYAARFRRPS